MRQRYIILLIHHINLVVSNALSPLSTGGPGDYVFNISAVKDGTGSSGIRDFTSTVTITLKEAPDPVISGNTTMPAGGTTTYSTPDFAGHAIYMDSQWGNNKYAVRESHQIEVTWGAGPAGIVSVQETVTNGGCTKTTPDYNVNITDIPSPSVTGAATVCNGETLVYRTAGISTHTYLWTILPSGGGSIIGGVNNLDSVVIQWTDTVNFYVKVAETGSTTVSDSMHGNS